METMGTGSARNIIVAALQIIGSLMMVTFIISSMIMIIEASTDRITSFWKKCTRNAG